MATAPLAARADGCNAPSLALQRKRRKMKKSDWEKLLCEACECIEWLQDRAPWPGDDLVRRYSRPSPLVSHWERAIEIAWEIEEDERLEKQRMRS
jgi:hypothetical protein